MHVKVVPCDPEFHKGTQSLRKHYTPVWRKLNIPLLTSSITIRSAQFHLAMLVNHFEPLSSKGVSFRRVCKRMSAPISRFTSSSWLSFNPGTVPTSVVSASVPRCALPYGNSPEEFPSPLGFLFLAPANRRMSVATVPPILRSNTLLRGDLPQLRQQADGGSEARLAVEWIPLGVSSGPHHQDSGEAKIRESTAGVSRKPSSDGKARGSSSKHLSGLTAWNT